MSWKQFIGNFVEIEQKPKAKPADIEMDKEPQIFKKSGLAYKAPTVKSSSNKYSTTFEKFLKEENDRNHPGHDYYEFTVMKERMAMIKDEGARYQATLAAVNIDKATLIST